MASMQCAALIATFTPALEGAPSGPLAGMRLAVKDNFDIAGHVTGVGSPEWAATHGPATTTAPLVIRLMEAGASVIGKAHMDELAYGLMGDNARYGTPPNPTAPGRMPGGSSSGSASAVAGGLADIGLGSDTGGSVRIPAAFCGLWGWRPTSALLPAAGMVPLAPSYDVPGLMVRKGATLAHLIDLLVPEGDTPALAPLAPADLWARATPETVTALAHLRAGDDGPLCDSEMSARLLPTFQICQGWDVAQVFRAWIETTNPALGPGVRERFAAALAITPDQAATAKAHRDAIAKRIQRTVGAERCIVLPTAPGPAPWLDVSHGELNQYRLAALELLCIAGHAGLPQITVPAAQIDGAPLGISVIGPAGSDRALMAFALTLV